MLYPVKPGPSRQRNALRLQGLHSPSVNPKVSEIRAFQARALRGPRKGPRS
nr:MAG TPA: hypothetical protein [Caudoviricetes sp.]